MTEYWINNQDDYNEYLSFLQKERLSPILLQKDNTVSKVKAGQFIVNIPDNYLTKYDPLIFGKNQEENIINITISDGKANIYKKRGDSIIQESLDYSPWLLHSKWLPKAERLKGNQYYKYLKHLPYDEYIEEAKQYDRNKWTPRSLEEGFMLLNGHTYYKGMKVSDVSLLSFDIEATTLDKDSKDAHVVLLSTTFRKDGKITKKLFEAPNKEQEQQMLQDVEDYVNECDPDILLGHNVLSYDIPYICAQKLLHIGRNKNPIVFEEKVSKFRKDGSQQYDYNNVKVFGREIVDTFFLSIKYDVNRHFPSYSLKKIEKHLGLVDENRIEWDFIKHPVRLILAEYKKGNIELWEKFKQYCQDDSDSPIKMFDIMIPAFFYMAQTIPKTLQQIINEAAGSYLDGLMIRSYLQEGYSQPKTSTKTQFEGAISMGVPNIYDHVRKVDIVSQYPSIMLQYNIYDKQKDPKCNMLKLVRYYLTERVNNKNKFKETKDKYFDDIQSSQKPILNSFYGLLGANYLLYNFPVGAPEVTRLGREILLKGIEWATGHTLKRVEKEIRNKGKEDEEISYEWVLGDKVSEGKNFQLVNADTDSFSITNGKEPTKEEFEKDINELNSLFPELIKWEDDGIFSQVIVVGAKNYVLKKDNKIKLKGSAFLSSNKEPVLKCFMNGIVEILLNNGIDYDLLKALHTKYSRDCLNVLDINEWCTKKTITKSVLNPERPQEQNVLDAINEAIEKNIISGYQEGDKIYLYRAIDGLKQKKEKGELVFMRDGSPKMIENTVLRYPELWDNDHDALHFIERIYDNLAIFENLIDMKMFTKYHNKKNRSLLT